MIGSSVLKSIDNHKYLIFSAKSSFGTQVVGDSYSNFFINKPTGVDVLTEPHQKPPYPCILKFRTWLLQFTGTSHRRTQYSNTTELMVRLDNLRPYTEYEFSVMLTKGSKSSQYSLSIRNTTQEDGRFDAYLYCAPLLFKWRPYWQFA